MKAKLTYFQANGKYYADGECEVDGSLPLYLIWKHIDGLNPAPGLLTNGRSFNVLIEVPDHEYSHPHMLMRYGAGAKESMIPDDETKLREQANRVLGEAIDLTAEALRKFKEVI